MPTADRRAFVPQAIRYFLRQDYGNRELIVLDDLSSDATPHLLDELGLQATCMGRVLLNVPPASVYRITRSKPARLADWIEPDAG